MQGKFLNARLKGREKILDEKISWTHFFRETQSNLHQSLCLHKPKIQAIGNLKLQIAKWSKKSILSFWRSSTPFEWMIWNKIHSKNWHKAPKENCKCSLEENGLFIWPTPIKNTLPNWPPPLLGTTGSSGQVPLRGGWRKLWCSKISEGQHANGKPSTRLGPEGGRTWTGKIVVGVILDKSLSRISPSF